MMDACRVQDACVHCCAYGDATAETDEAEAQHDLSNNKAVKGRRRPVGQMV